MDFSLLEEYDDQIDVNTIIYLSLRENKFCLKTKYILSSDGLCIRVHAREEIVHTEVGHGDTQEGQSDVDVIHQRLAENRQALRMHYYGIYHKGDERPRLLAIPTPVITPAHVSPDGSDEDAESHRGEGWVQEDAAQCLKLFAMRAKADTHDATDKGERQEGVAHHDDADMDAE